MQSFRFVLTGIALTLFMRGCGTLSQWANVVRTLPEPLNERRMARGIEVYHANHCGSCHTLTIAHAQGTFGPTHDQAGSAAAETILGAVYTGNAATAAAYIRESIVNPSAYYTPGYATTHHHMPSFAHLPETDIDALVYLLVNQTNQLEDRQT